LTVNWITCSVKAPPVYGARYCFLQRSFAEHKREMAPVLGRGMNVAHGINFISRRLPGNILDQLGRGNLADKSRCRLVGHHRNLTQIEVNKARLLTPAIRVESDDGRHTGLSIVAMTARDFHECIAHPARERRDGNFHEDFRRFQGGREQRLVKVVGRDPPFAAFAAQT